MLFKGFADNLGDERFVLDQKHAGCRSFDRLQTLFDRFLLILRRLWVRGLPVPGVLIHDRPSLRNTSG
jgi:hypothetical protein